MSGREAGGFAYLEVLLGIVILGLAVATMGAGLQSTRTALTERGVEEVAEYLVQDGLAWVQRLGRRDDNFPSSWGREIFESVLRLYDDVDDVDGLVQSPVSDQAGEEFDATWSRSFVVESVDPAAPDVVVADNSTDLMRVRVAALRGNVEAAAEVMLLWRTP
ncbi:MAG: type II secretion system protein [Planctomycetota bacterium]